jgi:hypothetical protein
MNEFLNSTQTSFSFKGLKEKLKKNNGKCKEILPFIHGCTVEMVNA